MPQNTDGTLQACRGGNILSSARSTIHVGPNKCLLRSLRGRKTYPPPPPPPDPVPLGNNRIAQGGFVGSFDAR